MATEDVPTPAIIAADTRTAIGPIFIANLLNWMLMGTLLMQAYTYYGRFAKDRLWIRVLVAVLLSLDIFHTVVLTAHGWYFTVLEWGHVDKLQSIPWMTEMIPFMCGIVAAIVQIFYAWRIWVLSRHRIVLRAASILVVMLALMQGLSAVISSIMLLINSDQKNLIRLHPGFSVWLAGSFTTDIIITICMTYVLWKARIESKWKGSETMLTRMINNTVQTGALTATCALVDLILFTVFIHNTFHQVPAYVLGKLYSNSLMLNLNLRKPHNLNDSYNYTCDGSDTLPMHYFRSTKDMNTVNTFQGSQTSRPPPPTRGVARIDHDIDESYANDRTKWDSDVDTEVPTAVNIQIDTSSHRDMS